jgi:class 3 adenylate cyclase
VGLKDDLDKQVKEIFSSRWSDRDGQKIPEDTDVGLGNDAVKLDGTVLYADISDSTKFVDNYKNWFAAEIYKTYLLCAARIIRSEGGTITAYDGDRVMAVYIGDYKNTSAVRTALRINYAVRNIIAPAMKSQYPTTDFTLKQVVGVDSSSLYVARTGIRGSNDLVWVGRAANYAAKLCSLSDSYPTYITDSVYNAMREEVRTTDGKPMWNALTWNAMNNMQIYGSTWWWSIT